ncbi:hypothetical protein [Staphylococcus agnetis]|uniref:hypothetical protein n=1 Tax=Staphylococcus agnetis TaxID=985762 RepID=UPI001FB26E09|nr:hypothetical protein [Staphylococcus agnetis]UOC12419.1 hypothetical protein K2V63_07680 [Staphylococcus agnetis]
MPMLKKEALHILRVVNDVYTMNLTKEKASTWIEILSEKGDYEPTLRKTKNYIANNGYKPKVADILAYKPKVFNYTQVPEEQTKEYLLKNDPNYQKGLEEARERWRRMREELGFDTD